MLPTNKSYPSKTQLTISSVKENNITLQKLLELEKRKNEQFQ